MAGRLRTRGTLSEVMPRDVSVKLWLGGLKLELGLAQVGRPVASLLTYQNLNWGAGGGVSDIQARSATAEGGRAAEVALAPSAP